MTTASRGTWSRSTANSLWRDRPLLGLAILLGVQILLIAGIYGANRRPAPVSEPLLPGLTPETVVALTVADAEGNAVRLARRGSEWVLPDADEFPALADRVTRLLEKLAGQRTRRLVARTPGSFARLGVDATDFVRRLEVELEDGTAYTLFLGTVPRPRTIHVRRADQEAVFLAVNLSEMDANPRPSAWINTAYFMASRESMVALTLENRQGRLEFLRQEDGSWTLAGLQEGEEFLQNNLESMLTTLTGLHMVRPLGKTSRPEYGLDDPAAVITLVTEEEGRRTTHTLRIGAYDPEDRQYVLASSDSDYIVRVADYTVERFVDRGRQDFVRPLEEEEAEESGG